ncbi:hypothetical protein ES706_00718 [subsurface metagenome]
MDGASFVFHVKYPVIGFNPQHFLDARQEIDAITREMKTDEVVRKHAIEYLLPPR